MLNMDNCRTSVTKGHKEQLDTPLTCGKTASPPPCPGLNKALKLNARKTGNSSFPRSLENTVLKLTLIAERWGWGRNLKSREEETQAHLSQRPEVHSSLVF